ncbi:hypothetical protein B0T14DRAFT_934 [Immersiella caudata]|uniref:Uncharacterized protein n=1 Tax=Immersiella caudata TaxID=314043 RepID=A0AA39XC94_9PEZI|nr:hypothetical protein B0T14DRAFT_934 [Immersiella caudata]
MTTATPSSFAKISIKMFDTRRFTFVPKRFGTSTVESAELVTHVLRPNDSPELLGLYHNRPLQPIHGISVGFLFARFVWSLSTDKHLPFSSRASSTLYACGMRQRARGKPKP